MVLDEVSEGRQCYMLEARCSVGGDATVFVYTTRGADGSVRTQHTTNVAGLVRTTSRNIIFCRGTFRVWLRRPNSFDDECRLTVRDSVGINFDIVRVDVLTTMPTA
jgi:hypothetical protein